MDDRHDSTDMLNEFAAGEDEFDVDLMACGCRLAAPSGQKMSIYEIATLYSLDQDKLMALLGTLIDESKIAPERVFELAEAAQKGRIKEHRK